MDAEPVSQPCPACWQMVELDVDPTLDHQVYIEDCPVCCRPMRVEVTMLNGEPRIEVSSGND